MLKNQLIKVEDLNDRAYILFALSEAGIKMKYHTKKLFEKFDKLDNYSRALLAITLQRHDENEAAKTVLKSLEKRANIQETFVERQPGGNHCLRDSGVFTG